MPGARPSGKGYNNGILGEREMKRREMEGAKEMESMSTAERDAAP